MAVVRRSIEVPRPLAEVFAFVGDFATSQTWDPGVSTAVKATDGPVGVGTVYDLQVIFNGRTLPMTYVVTAYEPDARVVLEGDGEMVTAVDDIRFTAVDAGRTRIDYSADLRLKGWRRLFEPMVRGRFEALGDAAMDGMRRTLGA